MWWIIFKLFIRVPLFASIDLAIGKLIGKPHGAIGMFDWIMNSLIRCGISPIDAFMLLLVWGIICIASLFACLVMGKNI